MGVGGRGGEGPTHAWHPDMASIRKKPAIRKACIDIGCVSVYSSSLL